MTSVAVPALAPPTRRQLRDLERAREAAAKAEAVREAPAVDADAPEEPVPADVVSRVAEVPQADEFDVLTAEVSHLPMGEEPDDSATQKLSVTVSRRELRTRPAGRPDARVTSRFAPRAAILTSLGVLTIAAPLTGFATSSSPAAAVGPMVRTETSVLEVVDGAAAARTLAGAVPTGTALQFDQTALGRANELASRELARTSVSACEPVTGASGMREAFTERQGIVYRPMAEGTYRDTSLYGPRWGAFHYGTDMAAALGTPIHAIADGVVIHAGGGKEGRSGQLVIIKHVIDGQDVWSWYGHMYTNGVHVSEGDTVVAGQVIAAIGNNGYSTGPHLHFELNVGEYGNTVNPLTWFSSAQAVFPGQC